MIRVAIADDHDLVREGMKSVIASRSDMQIVGEASNEKETLALVQALQIDVLLLDMYMDSRDSGLFILNQLQSVQRKPRILMMSMFAGPDLVQASLTKGASGFVTKGEPSSRVIDAILMLCDGKIYLSPEITTSLFSTQSPDSAHGTSPLDPILTPREEEVFELLGRGLTPAQAASEMEVSRSTIGTHIENIKKKMGIQRGRDLTFHAIRRKQATSQREVEKVKEGQSVV